MFIYTKHPNKQTKTLSAKNSFQLLLLRSIGALHCGDKTLNKENLHLKKSFKIGSQGQHIVPAQNRALLFKSQGLQVSLFIEVYYCGVQIYIQTTKYYVIRE